MKTKKELLKRIGKLEGDCFDDGVEISRIASELMVLQRKMADIKEQFEALLDHLGLTMENISSHYEVKKK